MRDKDLLRGRNRDMVEMWKSGEYTTAEIGAEIGLAPIYVGILLRRSGIFVGDKQYRNRRIVQLFDSGETVLSLASRFELAPKTIREIRQKNGKRERHCAVCNAEFAPKRPHHKYCSLNCQKHGMSKFVVFCATCGESFRTMHKGQKYCSQKCWKAFRCKSMVDRNLEIRKLSREGLSQRQVAERLGLSIGHVALICAPSSKLSQELKKVEYERQLMSDRKIGKFVSSYEQRRRKNALNNKNAKVLLDKNWPTSCVWCGKEFDCKSRDVKYCSASCKDKAKHARIRARKRGDSP